VVLVSPKGELIKMKLHFLFYISLVQSCGRFVFIGEKHIALFGHVIQIMTTPHQELCLYKCLETSQCMSVNKYENESGVFYCELNKSGKESSPNDLKPRPGFVYLQTVEVEHCTDDSLCHHKRALPNGWFQFGSKVYKFFHERKNWKNAEQVCQAEGGNLVSFTSELENKFVFDMFARNTSNDTAAETYNLISHWKLDGTDNDITLENGAKYLNETGRTYLYLNGAGAYATTPARNFREGSFTIACWVKLLNPVTSESAIYSIWPKNDHEKQFLFQASMFGKVGFAAINIDNAFKPLFSAGKPPIGAWFHAAVVWDRATNEVNLYINGTKVGTSVVQEHWYLIDRSHLVHHIGLKADTDQTLHGYLGDLMVLGKALNETGIKRISDDYEKDRGIWIGLHDVTGSGLYRWSDSTDVVYTKWASGQPDRRDNRQECVTIMYDRSGYWEDINCNLQLPFIWHLTLELIPAVCELDVKVQDDCPVDICIHKRALPDGWFQFGTKVYKKFSEKSTWKQAKQICQANGGNLVTIQSESENKFIFEMFVQNKTNTTHDQDQYNMIAHWKLDGTDHDITLVNGAEYVKEDGKNHLYLSGAGAHATTPARNFRDGSFTIASWVKLSQPVNLHSPIYSVWPSSGGQFLFTIQDGRLLFAAVNTDNSLQPLLHTSTPSPVDRWHHVAAVWDRTSDEVYLYLNGTRVATQGVQAHWYIVFNLISTHDIGLKADDGTTLKGFLSDLMVFGEALNEDGIRKILDDYRTDRGVWIGLNDVTGSGSYKWEDNTTLVYTKWANGAPDRRYNIQDCVTIKDDGSGHWEDINCYHHLSFICQKNA
ncbi:unnamed protein product, partial [Porites evermanni]